MGKHRNLFAFNHTRLALFEYYSEGISLLPKLHFSSWWKFKNWQVAIFTVTVFLCIPGMAVSQGLTATNCTLTCPESRTIACLPKATPLSINLGITDREVCHTARDCYGSTSNEPDRVQQRPANLIIGQVLIMRVDPINVISPSEYWQFYKVSSEQFFSCSSFTSNGTVVSNVTQSSSFIFNSSHYGPGRHYFAGSINNILRCNLGFRISITIKNQNCGISQPGDSPCRGKGICIVSQNDSVAQCNCCNGFNGTTCDEFDACTSNPCLNSGNCTDIAGGLSANFSCKCTPYYTGKTCETQIDYCNPMPCLNNATCSNLFLQKNYSCSCHTGFTGRNCGININDCVSNNCTHNATCVDLVNGYRCECNGNWTGEFCNQDINECNTINCLNNATCTNTPGSFYCTCPVNVTGRLCQTDLYDNCLSNPCMNQGTCKDLVGGFTCTCLQGYTGEWCESDVNECLNNPCAIEGTSRCINGPGNYTCVCLSEYTGRRCEKFLDRCASQPCLNGGLCVNLYGRYSCVCPAGYRGSNCQDVLNKCSYTPCKNNGTCERTGDFLSNYTCHCAAGWTGRNCTDDFNECQSNPCLNNATCQNLFNKYACTCIIGWNGTQCETNVDACETMPCKNNATCTDLQTGFDYTCTCAPGFTGKNCSVNIDDCARLNANCNNGRCVDQVGSYYCNCSEGWYGKNCDTNRNICASRPCLNGASCQNVNTTSGFVCSCISGWTGATCEINIDDCVSNLCQNGATCNDFLNYYNCTCRTGYTGQYCETEINECLSMPCRNNATCFNNIGNFSCLCLLGYTGAQCETNINECASLPCFNNATCVDEVNKYTCRCHGGYVGVHCEVPLCRTNPCRNRATCVQSQDRYLCQCQPGYTGQNCEIPINECGSSPCRNNATCVDLLNRYECSCLPGFTGVNCESDINECASNPCINGTCINKINGYSCNCSSMYTGARCETNMNLCASGPCMNNATCENNITALSFSCRCQDGYTGILCQNHLCDTIQPCLNNGTCLRLPHNYSCQCTAGYTGSQCEIDINECSSAPCLNSGTCENGKGFFTCSCPKNFTGNRCETFLDYCDPNPCNNGTCSNNYTSQSFECSCLPAFTGQRCELHICDVNNPCQNGATCIRNINNASCICLPGYTGRNCSVNVNECEPNPCINNGSCIDGIGGFTCQCPLRYTGSRCDVLADYCASSPCANSSTCVNDYVSGTYRCICHPYRTGRNCEVYLGPCYANPCFNNGTCVETLAQSFRCVCPFGFSGSRCESLTCPCQNNGRCALFNANIKCICPNEYGGALCDSFYGDCRNNASRKCIDDSFCVQGPFGYYCRCPGHLSGDSRCTKFTTCSPSPCLNNAGCTYNNNVLACACLAGYTGQFCQFDINECASNPCLNGGTCLEVGAANFTCFCPSNYFGDRCQNETASTSILQVFTSRISSFPSISTYPIQPTISSTPLAQASSLRYTAAATLLSSQISLSLPPTPYLSSLTPFFSSSMALPVSHQTSSLTQPSMSSLIGFSASSPVTSIKQSIISNQTSFLTDPLSSYQTAQSDHYLTTSQKSQPDQSSPIISFPSTIQSQFAIETSTAVLDSQSSTFSQSSSPAQASSIQSLVRPQFSVSSPPSLSLGTAMPEFSMYSSSLNFPSTHLPVIPSSVGTAQILSSSFFLYSSSIIQSDLSYSSSTFQTPSLHSSQSAITSSYHSSTAQMSVMNPFDTNLPANPSSLTPSISYLSSALPTLLSTAQSSIMNTSISSYSLSSIQISKTQSSVNLFSSLSTSLVHPSSTTYSSFNLSSFFTNQTAISTFHSSSSFTPTFQTSILHSISTILPASISSLAIHSTSTQPLPFPSSVYDSSLTHNSSYPDSSLYSSQIHSFPLFSSSQHSAFELSLLSTKLQSSSIISLDQFSTLVSTSYSSLNLQTTFSQSSLNSVAHPAQSSFTSITTGLQFSVNSIPSPLQSSFNRSTTPVLALTNSLEPPLQSMSQLISTSLQSSFNFIASSIQFPQSSFVSPQSSSVGPSNPCTPNPCLQGGNCTIVSAERFNCSCEIGFGGERCNNLVCQCQNNGRCVRDSPSSNYRCVCQVGFSGKYCENLIGDCRTQNCSGNGFCRERLQGFVCECNRGYYGDKCENYTNTCQPNPCQNSGICLTRSNASNDAFSCACPPGYQGQICQFDYNECASLPCLNGGTCRETRINSYECFCSSWSYGTNCELVRSSSSLYTTIPESTSLLSSIDFGSTSAQDTYFVSSSTSSFRPSIASSRTIQVNSVFTSYSLPQGGSYFTSQPSYHTTLSSKMPISLDTLHFSGGLSHSSIQSVISVSNSRHVVSSLYPDISSTRDMTTSVRPTERSSLVSSTTQPSQVFSSSFSLHNSLSSTVHLTIRTSYLATSLITVRPNLSVTVSLGLTTESQLAISPSPTSFSILYASSSSVVPTSPPLRNLTCIDKPCNGYPCYNESNDSLKFRCVCYQPSFGPRCIQGITIRFPYFNGYSFVEYAFIPFNNIINTIVLTFRTTRDNGLLLYAGHQTYRDFILLRILNGVVEFRFNAGAETVSITTLERVNSGALMTVVATHDSRSGTGTLSINSSAPISRSSSLSFTSIQLSTSWFIGGLNNSFRPVNSSNGIPELKSLVGCIRDLQVNTVPYRVIRAKSWLSISECDVPACQRGPCRNNATCIQNQENPQNYICRCGTGYYGQDCTEREAHCQGDPCNGGTCAWTPTGHTCLCQYGKHGASCLSLINITRPTFSLFDNYSSYVEYPWQQTVRNADLRFDIKMQFKLDLQNGRSTQNGLLVFTGQSTIGASGDDFFALGIINNYTYLIYNLGGGLASLRSSLKIDHTRRWHFIVAGRNGRSGYLHLDNQPAVYTTSPGVLTGLDVYSPLYLGGVPDFSKLPPIVRSYFSSGFVGTIFDAAFRTNASNFNSLLTFPTGSVPAGVMGVAVQRGLNVGDDNVNECLPNPCQNNGTCSQSGGQFICSCQTGWTGITCQDSRIPCIDFNPCSPGSVCQPNVKGVSCDCQFGRMGVYCDQTVNVTQPFFKANSFLGFERPDVKYFTKVYIRFKAAKVDGLLVYLSERTDSSNGDFFAISLWQGYVYVRFNLGLSTAVMRSRNKIRLKQWHELYVERRHKEAIMRLDSFMYVGVRSSGSYTQLNVGSVVYLGGLPRLSALNPSAVKDVSSQRDFEGTVSRFIVNDIVQVYNSARAIVGRNIEDVKRTCVLNDCQNNAKCSTPTTASNFSYICSCNLGWQGGLCNAATPSYKRAKFNGDGFIFYQDNITTPVSDNHIELSFNTSNDGLLMWIGDLKTNNSEFIALAIKNSKFTFRINTGGGVYQMQLNQNVSDGVAHRAIVTRNSQTIFLTVNGFFPIFRNYLSSDYFLDNSGHVYIGGLDGSLSSNARGEYSVGFTGCIWDVKISISNEYLNLNKNAFNRGVNVLSCD